MNAILSSAMIGEEAGVFVVMEDEPRYVEFISQGLSGFGFRMIPAENLAEVEQYAEKGEKNFILDVDMGPGRRNEGLDALERVKAISPGSFGGVLSNHSDLRWQARNLKADVFVEKSDDKQTDVQDIVARMWLKKCLEPEFRRLSPTDFVRRGAVVEAAFQMHRVAREGREETDWSPANDANYWTLQHLLADTEWRRRQVGKFVAIVDGEVVGVGESRGKVVEDVTGRYPDRRKLVTKIRDFEEEEDVLDLPRGVLSDLDS